MVEKLTAAAEFVPRLPVESSVRLSDTFQLATLACAVCGRPTSTPLHSFALDTGLAFNPLRSTSLGTHMDLPNSGMNRVKQNIVTQVKTMGSFQVTGLTSFWTTQKEALCSSCLRKLEKAERCRQQAKQLLVEARKLAPGDAEITRNLKAVS